MKLNQINPKSKLKRQDLKETCYYKFSNLDDYIFIYSSGFPNEIIPIINNKKEDLTIEYGQFIERKDPHIQPVEIIYIDNILYTQEMKASHIPVNLAYDSAIHIELYPTLQNTSFLKNRNKFLTLHSNNEIKYYIMHHYKEESRTDCLFFVLQLSKPVLDTTIYSKNNIQNNSYFRQMYVDSIDYRYQ